MLTALVRYMYNKYIALPAISAVVPIFLASRIYNAVKNYLNFHISGELSFELIITQLITLSIIIIFTCIIYMVFNFIAGICVKIYKEAKNEITRINQEVYYPTQKEEKSDKGTVSYYSVIEIIKTSIFGVHTKHQAVITGILKERGGCVVKKQSTLVQIFDKNGYEEYMPTSEELFEEKKEELIYQKILQEFLQQSEKYNGENITRLPINKNQLEDFLYKKQLEIQ